MGKKKHWGKPQRAEELGARWRLEKPRVKRDGDVLCRRRRKRDG